MGQQELVKVKVREFNKEKRKYEILNSIGPWTATITAGDWFTLSTDDGQSVVGTSKSVTGTGGDIVFNYKPNSSTGSSSTNRYGAIKVTYHNNRCEHMIYLRQGYADTQLLDVGQLGLYSIVRQKALSPTLRPNLDIFIKEGLQIPIIHHGM